MATWAPELCFRAWQFAARAHQGQRVPASELPYVVHVSSVAMEVMSAIAARENGEERVALPDLAVACALLHDVVEDTPVAIADIVREFGAGIAAGVSALTKNAALAKQERMDDSLARILQQPHEVWMVKLADRITNLAPPPSHWGVAKIDAYRQEARLIHDALGSACPVLGPRLAAKIAAYPPR
jgi:(p)ppGpp synthase/HD superfamily hydrolase